jgi:hypothetical protein
MTEVICFGESRPCVLRGTRLDADCAPLTGPTDGIILAAIADIALTPEMKEATFLEPEDACGNVVFVTENPARVKRYSATINLIVIGHEARELLTDGTLIVGDVSSPWAGDSIGHAAPGLRTPVKPGVGLEFWTQVTADGASGPCAADPDTPNWERHVLPRATLHEAARTFNGEVSNFTFEGTVFANPAFGDPYNDFPGVTVPTDSPHYDFFDVAPPDAVCGYVTGS